MAKDDSVAKSGNQQLPIESKVESLRYELSEDNK